jgi:hypothetical protein
MGRSNVALGEIGFDIRQTLIQEDVMPQIRVGTIGNG